MTPAELAIELRGKAGARLATWEWWYDSWALTPLLGMRRRVFDRDVGAGERERILAAEALALSEGWAVVERPPAFQEFAGLGRWPAAPGEVEPHHIG